MTDPRFASYHATPRTLGWRRQAAWVRDPDTGETRYLDEPPRPAEESEHYQSWG